MTLDRVALVKDSPGGYVLHGRRLTLQGQACDAITGAGQHSRSVALSCPGQP